MDTNSSPTAAFIAHVKEECHEHGVKLSFRRGRRVNSGDNVLCSGYFDDHGMARLSVATGDGLEHWLPVLVHEFCHMQQWKENTEVWRNAKEEKLFAWLGGKITLSKRGLMTQFRYARDLELDCERRSVRMIERWRLPIDIPAYIKAANAYLAFYAVLRDHQIWYVEAPYRVPQILKIMPARFMTKYQLDYPPRQYIDLALHYCAPKRVMTA